MKNILFSFLNIPSLNVDLDKLKWSYEKLSTQDNYRNCRHIALYTSNGSTESGNLSTNHMKWTSEAEKNYPEIIEYIEKNVFNWTTTNGRIAIICTNPKEKNPPHIDCHKEKFYTTQLKFRHVLHGNVDDLSFIGSDYNLSPLNLNKPFIMAGEWPHSMLNTSNDIKFTLAMGAPWNAEEDSNFINNNIIKKGIIMRSDITLEENYEKYFINNAV